MKIQICPKSIFFFFFLSKQIQSKEKFANVRYTFTVSLEKEEEQKK